MEEDFLIEMDYAGLTARLKRLSDAFVYSTKEFYKSIDLDIEPNWHMIFLILQKNYLDLLYFRLQLFVQQSYR